MWKNYLKIAWRNISRNRVYTIINVTGLAFGICTCLVIYLIASYEFSFDKFHPDRQRIYRITGEFQRSNGEKEFLNSIVSDLGGIQTEIPGFEARVGVHNFYPSITITAADTVKKFDAGNDVVITWPEYFEIFKYEWIIGQSATALSKPFQVVLTESKARKYFGTLPLNEIVGKTIVYDDSINITVSGIVKDWPGNSDLRYTDLISIGTVSHSLLKTTIPTDDWRSLQPHRSMAFVKLDKSTTASKVNAQLKAYIRRHIKPVRHGSLMNLELQPLSRIHFTNDYYRGDDGDGFRKAHLPTLYTLIGIALFILVIASVNFINLTTAQSIRRSKEISVRKVLGSNKRSLVFQFLTETGVITFFSLGIALLLVNPVLSLFGDYIPKGVSLKFPDFQTIGFLILIMLLTTLLAGFYPARILSSYLPVVSLKGPFVPAGMGKPTLRKALIVFQFSLALIFIISSVVIRKQISFMQNKDKGFKTDAVLTIYNWGDESGKMKVLKRELEKLHGIDRAILQGTPPMGFAENESVFTYKDGTVETTMQLATKMGHADFIPFYQIKLLAGRNMLQADSVQELLINEACSKALGFTNPADAIGRFLYGNNKPLPIVGVVANFHTGSFHEPIKPVVLAHMPQWERSLAVKLSSAGKKMTDVKAVIASIEKEWKKIYPGQGLEYNFLDESISWLYEKDKQTGWLMNIAMIITIIISCMGLFGLAMFTAESRTKEIGIRKVLGASVFDITSMLSKEIAILVLIAMLVASPVAWYFMNNWLQDFAYRTTFSWWVFIFSGFVAVFISLLTVSLHAIKTALSNPASSLRTE